MATAMIQISMKLSVEEYDILQKIMGIGYSQKAVLLEGIKAIVVKEGLTPQSLSK